jgi:hypothetical protein
MWQIIDFGIGVIFGGLALSASWGWLWLVISAIGLARGVCGFRVVMNSLVVGMTPLLLGWGVWWLRAGDDTPTAAFVGGLLVMPLLLTGLGLRRASDGRRVGRHMVEGILHLRDQLLGMHHDCGGCGHDHDVDSARGCP